jgi:hydroxymethylglutaryl-CoA lyase
MTESIVVNELALRNGIQNHPRWIPTRTKLRLLEALLGAGITHIEVANFVSPTSARQLTDAPALYAKLPRKDCIDYSVWVANLKSYERAAAAKARSITIAVAATDAMNRHLLNMSLAERIWQDEEILRRACREGIQSRVCLAAAFHCPYNGDTDPGHVRQLAARLFEAGADEVVLFDTLGNATPQSVKRLFKSLGDIHGPSRLRARFRDTHGSGLANCRAAAECGCRKFDTSIGGLGGQPFGPLAALNVATEDVVHMFAAEGLGTGIDLDRLAEAVTLAETATGASLGGHWLRAQRFEAASLSVSH